MNVLLVDDSQTTLEIHKAALVRDGHRVVVATSGEMAWRHLTHARFDVVVTDWMMPKMTGLALMARIIERGEPRPGLVVATIRGSGADRLKAQSAGADVVLQKPVSPDALVAGVAQAAMTFDRSPGGSHSVVGAPSLVVLLAEVGGAALLDRLAPALRPAPQTAYLMTLAAAPWAIASRAASLDKQAQLQVRPAAPGGVLSPGSLSLVGHDVPLAIDRSGRLCRLRPTTDRAQPLDRLLTDLARTHGARATAVFLAGMSRNGQAGARALNDAGGRVLALAPQDSPAPALIEHLLEGRSGTPQISMNALPGFLAA